MASAIPQPPPVSLDQRQFFCHQCNHRFMKPANALFQCPRCNEGFIEEVTGDFDRRSPSPPEPAFPLSFISILNEFSMINDQPARRARVTRRNDNQNQGSGPRASSASRAAASGSRGGSGGVLVIGNSGRGEGNEGNPGDIRIRLGLGRGAGRAGFFAFPLDDIMSTLFTAAAVQNPIMTDTQLEEIPKATISQIDVEAQSQCAVCFEDYAVNEPDVRKLPCTHLFHEKCIFPWLKNNATCPVCRARMPNAPDNDEETSDIDDVVIGELSRFMEFRTRENRNRQSSRNEQQSSRGRNAVRRPTVRPSQYPLRDREASTSSVQTRSRAISPLERTRPETRATTAAANVDTRSGQSTSRGPSPRRTNLRRVPAMPSLIPPITPRRLEDFTPAPRMPAVDPDMNVDLQRVARRREQILLRTERLREERQRLQNIRDLITRRSQRDTASSTSSGARTGLTDATTSQNTSNGSGPSTSRGPRSNMLFTQSELRSFADRFNGVTTRTRSRQNAIENLNGSSSSSSSSSNSSLVSISSASSEDIAIIDDEPPRRRRRITTLSSSD